MLPPSSTIGWCSAHTVHHCWIQHTFHALRRTKPKCNSALSWRKDSDRFGKTLIPQNWNNTLGNKSTYQGGQYTIVRFNRSAGSLSQEIGSNNLNGDWHLCTGLSACWQEKLSSLRELLHFVPSVSELLSVPCSHHLESRCPCLVPLGWDVANSALSALITSPGTCAVSWDWSVSQRCGTDEW